VGRLGDGHWSRLGGRRLLGRRRDPTAEGVGGGATGAGGTGAGVAGDGGAGALGAGVAAVGSLAWRGLVVLKTLDAANATSTSAKAPPIKPARRRYQGSTDSIASSTALPAAWSAALISGGCFITSVGPACG